MTTPTSNPVPSEAPQDLLFNAGAIDRAVSSSEPEYTDRLGVLRLTVAGAIESIKAINNRGAWATGVIYAAKDVASSGGAWYIALSGHVAGATFAGDQATYWRLYQGITSADLRSTALSKGGELVGLSPLNAYSFDTVGGAIFSRGASVGDRSATPGTTEFNAATAVAALVFVPSGAYAPSLTSSTYWKLWGTGAVVDSATFDTIEVSPFPQTGATVKSYKVKTFGRYENACALTATINSGLGQTRENTQIMGTSDSGLATYQDRDHVALHVSASSFAPTTTTAGSTTYSSTSITAPEISAATHKPGTIIDTLHGTPYVGVIRSVSGTTAIVGGWYLYGTGVAGTPAGGTAARINPNTKIWGGNVNLFLTTGGQATKGVGIELGISASKTGSGANTWGYDAITLGGEAPAAHFISRGIRTVSFLAQNSGGSFGFLSDGQNVGCEVRDPTAFAFNAVVSGVSKFSVANFGQVQGDYRQVTVNAAGTYTILDTDAVIVNVSGSAAITLPAVSGRANRIYTIVATAAAVMKNPGGTTLKTIAAGTTGVCACDGSFWY